MIFDDFGWFWMVFDYFRWVLTILAVFTRWIRDWATVGQLGGLLLTICDLYHLTWKLKTASFTDREMGPCTSMSCSSFCSGFVLLSTWWTLFRNFPKAGRMVGAHRGPPEVVISTRGIATPFGQWQAKWKQSCATVPTMVARLQTVPLCAIVYRCVFYLLGRHWCRCWSEKHVFGDR